MWMFILLSSECDFIVHKKCEGRVFVKCSLKAETDAVLQRDRAIEVLEETTDPQLEKVNTDRFVCKLSLFMFMYTII